MLHQLHVQLFFLKVGTCYFHLYGIAKLVSLLGAFANKAIVVFVKYIEIVGKVADKYHALALVFIDLAVYTPFGNARYNGIEGLPVTFTVVQGGGKLFEKLVVKAVDDVSFYINKGETLGLVGESGCGKTTTGRSLLRLHEPTAGKIFYDGEDITHVKMLPYRRKMQIVFQDPYSSFTHGGLSDGFIMLHIRASYHMTYQLSGTECDLLCLPL